MQNIKDIIYHNTKYFNVTGILNILIYENVDRYIPTYNHRTILDALNDTLNIDLNAEYFKPKYLNKL